MTPPLLTKPSGRGRYSCFLAEEPVGTVERRKLLDRVTWWAFVPGATSATGPFAARSLAIRHLTSSVQEQSL